MNWIEYLKNELLILNQTIDTIKKYEVKYQSHSHDTLMAKFQALNIMLLFSEKYSDSECFEKVCKRICETTSKESISLSEYSQYILKMPREE